MTKKTKIGGAIVAVLVVAGTVTGLELSSSGPPTRQAVGLCSTCVAFPPTFNGAAISTGIFTSGGGTTQGTCLTNGSATPNSGTAMTNFLASLSPGTEVDFNPNSTHNLCYVVMLKGDETDGQGLFVPRTNNLTLNGQGATLFFNSNAAAMPCNGSCQLPAVVTANGRTLSPQPTGLHIQNFNVVGVDVTGAPGQGAGADFNSGILIEGLTNVNVTNVSVSHVFGDCMTIQNAQGATSPVNQGLVVNDFSGVSCGRQGISPISLNNALFTNISLPAGRTGQASWDFEADSEGFGAKNVIIKNCVFNGIVQVEGGMSQFGPITIQNCVDGGARNSDGTAGGANSTAFLVKSLNSTIPNGRFLLSNDKIRCGAGPGPCFDIGLNNAPNNATCQPNCQTNATVQVHSSVICVGNSSQSRPNIYTVSHNSNLAFIANTTQGYYTTGVGTVAPGSTFTTEGGTYTNSTFGVPCTTGWPFSYNPTNTAWMP